jgi:cytochrome P450
MRADPLGTMARAFAATGDGDAVFMRLGPFKATFFRNPDHVKRVLVDNVANYSKRTRGYEKAKLVLGDGLVTSEGELWQRQRRIATPAFHRQRIAGFASTITGAANAWAEKLRGGGAVSSRGQQSADTADGGFTRSYDHDNIATRPHQPLQIDLYQELMTLTLHLAVQTLFGIEPSPKLVEVSAAVTEVLERTNDIITNPISLPLWTPLPKYRRFKRALGVLDSFVYETIARRKQEAGDANDLLSMLLAARDEESGQGMSDRLLRDECVTILIAGHETTAIALAWAGWMLSEHPRHQATLAAEVREVLGDRPAGFDDLPKLKFTRAVVDESMRMYPPAWMIGRHAVADDAVGPYLIRAGEFALISPWLLHRNPKLWDNPATFDPTRFIDGRSDAAQKFAYLPFGGGPRFCIGANFALMEAVLLLATIVQRFQLHPVEQRIEPYAMITLRPKWGVKVRLTPREQTTS